MPYQIKKQGSKYCVYNKDTGENKGCSDSRDMAIKHMRALYANAGDTAKGIGPVCDCQGCAEMAKEYEVIDEPNLAEQIVSSVKAMLGLGGPQAMTLTKQADGRTRVMLRVSNIYKDRHGEIITTAAHKEYEAYVEETKEYPEFWLWHTPGSRWGKADLVSFDDGFLTMSGLVDQGKEYIAEGLAARQGDLGVSHGFKYIKLGEDTIDWYRSFEASPLPREHAANVWTGMMLAKEWEMGLAERQKKFFAAVGVPEAVIAEWDSGSKDLAAQLKEIGIEYKEVEPSASVATKTETVAQAPAVATPEQAAAPVAGGEESAVLAELKKLNERFDAVEAKQKAMEQTIKDSVAETMAAAIVPGASSGFVASKQGEKPTEEESKVNDSWLAELIMGGR
jgi:hypothetical protein